MKNVYSQRNKERIYGRREYLSKELRGQIFRLIQRFRGIYSEEPFNEALADLYVFYPLKAYNEQGEFVETRNFEKFIMNTNPAFVLDFIELFADNVGDDFQHDINILFINDKSKYRLESGIIVCNNISYPKVTNQGLDDLIYDIENNIKNGSYKMVVDRLHTYTSSYLDCICKKRNLKPIVDKNDHIVIDGTMRLIKDFFAQNGIIETKFSLDAITMATGLLTDYNSVRNDHSFAHVNKVLEQAEAKFVVANVCALLEFIDKLDNELK